MAHSFDIVGYSYRADVYGPECIVAAMRWTPMEDRATAELALDDIAHVAGIDRQDERTYDSFDFPKVIFRDQLQPDSEGYPETCSQCGKVLGE